VGTGSFPGVKWPARGVDHLPPYSTKVKERVELYLYPPSGPSWPLLGLTLLLLYNYYYYYYYYYYHHHDKYCVDQEYMT
jgi:hypothetical protein